MALTTQPPAPDHWARWPQHAGSEYVMTAQQPTPAPLHHADYPQYCTTAPMNASIVAPPYHPPVTYSAYAPYPSPALESPLKPEPTLPLPQPMMGFQHPRTESVGPEPARCSPVLLDRPAIKGCPSPPIKREPARETDIKPNPTPGHSRTPSKSPTPGQATDSSCTTGFNTGVDALVRAIQAKAKAEVGTNKVGHKPASTSGRKGEAQRKYVCDEEGCGLRFQQKTHLTIHQRSHTGDRPFRCSIPGCGQYFSQQGNLRTHERRHTGEKPHKCTKCEKRFAQQGNLKSHMRTHQATRPFTCKLDRCGRTFTQRGNLKSHQNRFHLETLQLLAEKFASLPGCTAVSPEEKELWEYFATTYKHSNKGIKGRGKGRRVGPVGPAAVSENSNNNNNNHDPLSPTTPTSTPTMTPTHINSPDSYYSASPGGAGYPQMLPQISHHHHHQTAQPLRNPLPFHGLSHPAAYSISRPNILLNESRVPNNNHHNYDMFDAEDPRPTIYEDYGRELAFGDRMY